MVAGRRLGKTRGRDTFGGPGARGVLSLGHGRLRGTKGTISSPLAPREGFHLAERDDYTKRTHYRQKFRHASSPRAGGREVKRGALPCRVAAKRRGEERVGFSKSGPLAQHGTGHLFWDRGRAIKSSESGGQFQQESCGRLKKELGSSGGPFAEARRRRTRRWKDRDEEGRLAF